MPSVSQSFRQALISVFEDHVAHKKPLPISWACAHCYDKHSGNLFKKVHAVAVVDGEPNSISLEDENGKPFAIINISKNKKPNLELASTFQEKSIIYLQISLPVDREPDALESISKPLFVNACLNPRCKKCGGYQGTKSMVVIESKCWKCKGRMKVALMDCNGYYPGPEHFSADEIAFANSKGALIRNNYSKTAGATYMSNTCPGCEALTGQHYLFTDHYTEAMNGYFKYESYPAGYSCEHCDMGYE